MPSGAMLRIRLSRGRVVILAAAVAAMNVLMLAATAAADTVGADAPWRLRLAAEQVDLALERNAAAWYSSMLLLSVALACAFCFAVDARSGGGRASRVLGVGWLLLAALFAALSLDELGSLHERVNDLLHFGAAVDLVRVAGPGWVGVLAVPFSGQVFLRVTPSAMSM